MTDRNSAWLVTIFILSALLWAAILVGVMALVKLVEG
jgi:hypothetical protein